jgi:hypothetical protein
MKPGNFSQKGIALVITVVGLSLLLLLVITTSVLVTVAYKKANFVRDWTIAHNLAESGIADALYRLNYRYYDSKIYPNIYPDTGIFVPKDDQISKALYNPDGCYEVLFSNSNVTNGDELISSGTYKGRKCTLKSRLRGDNAPGTLLGGPAQGIAEAFNKHAIYARSVTIGNNVADGGIKGNICAVSITDKRTGNITDCTKTKIVQADVPEYTVSLPPDPGLNEYKWVYSSAFNTGPVGGFNNPLGAPEGYYDKNTRTFSFTNPTIDFSEKTLIQESVVFNGSATITESGHVVVERNVMIAGTGITNDGILKSGRNLTITGANISCSDAKRPGRLYAIGFLIATDSVISNDLHNLGQDATLTRCTVNGSVVSGGSVTLVPWSAIISAPGKPALCVYQMVAARTVRLDRSGAEKHVINGLIYVGNGKVEIQGDSEIYGSIVCGGMGGQGSVTINRGTLSYDSPSFYSSDPTYAGVFSNFTGGRRVYLVVPGSFREE